MLSSRQNQDLPAKISAFRERFTQFAPHLLFDSTFEAEQKLWAMTFGFGVNDSIVSCTFDGERDVLEVAVRFEPKQEFVYFRIVVADGHFSTAIYQGNKS